MFPDSSGLSDDSQSGASHLWPTMVPPRYSPPHSHPDEKPPPYSPWAARSLSVPQRRLAVLRQSRRRTWESRGAGEEEEERGGREVEGGGRGRGHRRSMHVQPKQESECLSLWAPFTLVSVPGVAVCVCACVRVSECIHMKPDVQLVTRTVYWRICCLNVKQTRHPSRSRTTRYFFPLFTPSRVRGPEHCRLHSCVLHVRRCWHGCHETSREHVEER